VNAGQGSQLGSSYSRRILVHMILRLYGPLEPWFKQTWQPNEIELVK
jgi:hypothetical protein